MAVKTCCIDNCHSSSTRSEDKGVTYHKFPKNVTLRDIWMSVTQITHCGTDSPLYVCSRHFCKNDFKIYKDSKYILRSDAVPSIFPWIKVNSDIKMESENIFDNLAQDADITSTSIKDSEIESIDAIKRFIEEQEKEIQEQERELQEMKNNQKIPPVEKMDEDSMDSKINQSETISVASSVMDMIIHDSDLELAKKADMKNKIMSPTDKGNNNTALSIGSKVEAKDFGEVWYPAEIMEVDYDEMEVLVHYDMNTKKSDEWISVNSPRLRPSNGTTTTDAPVPSAVESGFSDQLTATVGAVVKEEPIEPKTEEKAKPMFEVGQRCLARWRDNRRFVATVNKILDNGSYEVIFDDGCYYTCTSSRLYKLKPGKDGVPYGSPGTPVTSSPHPEPGPSNITPQLFHTHLFDPTRDYLGSKSERREMKRKLNIKEIFNIGQKRPKVPKVNKEPTNKPPVVRKPRIIRRRGVKLKPKVEVKTEAATENTAVDAVASIIGTIDQNNSIEIKQEIIDSKDDQQESLENNSADLNNEITCEAADTKDYVKEVSDIDIVVESDKVEIEDLKPYMDPEVLDEVKLEQFDKPDEEKHEETLDRIKEAINKLEDGLKFEEAILPKRELHIKISKLPEIKDIKSESVPKTKKNTSAVESEVPEKGKKKLHKIKSKKLRLLNENIVNNKVALVKSELDKMRKQVEDMRIQMLKKQESPKVQENESEVPKEVEMNKSFLLPGEWCCKWVNGQPVGAVSEIECEVKQDASGIAPLPRRSVQVEDERLPEGWTKHMVRRSFGNSAGKWDVVLINPNNRRFHTKNEMRTYLQQNPELNLMSYEAVLIDFGVHLKLARRMGWISNTPDGATDGPVKRLPAGTLSSTSPLVKRKKLTLNRQMLKGKTKRTKLAIKMKRQTNEMASDEQVAPSINEPNSNIDNPLSAETDLNPVTAPLEDGCVYVGSLKVHSLGTFLRCPAENCFKNFRNSTLLKMHINHYHRELKKMMGKTPKVLDLASARSKVGGRPDKKLNRKVIKVKIPRLKTKMARDELQSVHIKDKKPELDSSPSESNIIPYPIPRSQDSPKLRQALANRPVKRPRVLLPVRRLDPEPIDIPDIIKEDIVFDNEELIETVSEAPMAILDFETAISTHTVTKPFVEKTDKKIKGEKKKRSFALPPKMAVSEEEDWFGMNSDVDTRSSFPGSETPDSKIDVKPALVSSESNDENKEIPNNTYMYDETGERIKIVHMKREEIINCHCGFREEDGLMVQCELCLCWQHALCHNIQREADVPEKYTCSICLNPRRGRRSKRFVHDQDRLYEGLLPASKPCESLRRSHELTGNLLRIEDALHALRIKCYVATKKDHPKLYLWAKDWEQAEIQYTQEKLNSDYSDLNIIINNIGKENLPVRPDDVRDMSLDMRTSPSISEIDHERLLHRDLPLSSQSLLSGLLSSPGGASLDLPISTLELERLAKTVQEQESVGMSIVAPVPEAAIENGACRERLLRHLQRCQALVDARLDSIEAQVAELESQDPSFEDDDTADYFPRTKQTIQMLMRDLDTMDELGVIT